MIDVIPYDIDINDDIEEVVTVKQYDHKSRFICFTLRDRDITVDTGGDNPKDRPPMDLTGCKARMYVRLSEGDCVYFDGSVDDGAQGAVSFLLPNSVTKKVGEYRAEIWLTDPVDSSIISTRQFTVRVLESIRDNEAIEATSQFTALDTALNKIDKVTDICENATVNANQAAQNANGAANAANAAADAAREAAAAVTDGIDGIVDGIVVKDTATDTVCLVKFRLIDGKPAVDCTEI